MSPYRCPVCTAHGFWTLSEYVLHVSQCLAIARGIERELIAWATSR